ncbi:MAG: ribbon-helix-helix domain-containing protein [Methylobacteriaceae bacterium]|nr:ribbon-helix-helix domain-containing protein [Methylobacteriaceae bacterium]
MEARPTDLSKHSLVIAGHRTSISLERAFWDALQAIAREQQVSIAALVASVDAQRGGANLSSALRVFVLKETARRDEAAGRLTSSDRAT